MVNENNVVDTVVLASDGDYIGPNWIMSDTAVPGGIYNAATGEFSTPDYSPLEPDESRHISVGAFYDRFGAAKYAILADANPAVQALIMDTSVRKYIDLDRSDLSSGLQLLVDAGHAIDPNAIISAEIKPEEKP